jgi:hypothetical protein
MCIFKRKKKLEIGQIWESHDDNPFHTNYLCAEIFDLKNEWVQYCIFYKNEFDINKEYHKFSTKEDSFRFSFEDFVVDNRKYFIEK